jgi:hypothetical protein
MSKTNLKVRSGYPCTPVFRWKKLSSMLMMTLFTLFSTSLVAQTVNLSLKNVPLEKARKEIEKQTGYYFVYPKDMRMGPPLAGSETYRQSRGSVGCIPQ